LQAATEVKKKQQIASGFSCGRLVLCSTAGAATEKLEADS
jgi:hypothetical protein